MMKMNRKEIINKLIQAGVILLIIAVIAIFGMSKWKYKSGLFYPANTVSVSQAENMTTPWS